MATKASVFFDRLRDKKIAIVGMGTSNIDLVRMLANKGLDLIVYDKRTPEELGDLYTEFSQLGVCLELGPRYLSRLGGEDIIFRTPGMNYLTPELSMARYAGTIVTSELEVFFDICPCKIIGVTGTDGKTSTTNLIAKLLKSQGKKVYIGGNTGGSLLPIIDKIHPKDYAVIELSSFQLISMGQSPNTAVITNIRPTHLGMHKTMEDYIKAKKNIFAHQNGFARTVINGDNGIIQKFAPEIRGKLFQFSRNTAVQRGAWVDNRGIMWYAENDSQTKIMEIKDVKLLGKHNLENLLASISAVWGTVSKENIVKVATTFDGMEHHTQRVCELDGVTYYNDAVAIRTTHTITSLNALDTKLVAIMGGDEPCDDLESLADAIMSKVKTLILIGDSGKAIQDTLTALPHYNEESLPVFWTTSLEDAVELARQHATAGDCVMLSPACESPDRYPNFTNQGNHFKNLVNELK